MVSIEQHRQDMAMNPNALAAALGSVLSTRGGVAVMAEYDPMHRETVYIATVQQRTEVRVHEEGMRGDPQEVLSGLYDDLHRQGDASYGPRIRDERDAEVRAIVAERDRLAEELARAQRVIDKLTGEP